MCYIFQLYLSIFTILNLAIIMIMLVKALSLLSAQSEGCSSMSNVAQVVFVFVFCCSLLSQRVFKSICAGYTGCPKGHRELPHRRASIISRLPPYINIRASFEMQAIII